MTPTSFSRSALPSPEFGEEPKKRGQTHFSSHGWLDPGRIGDFTLVGAAGQNGQIRSNEKDGLAPFVDATVQRARPVILTALAAMLAFIPLTHSVFWGTLAYTLIGDTFAGTVLTLVFLPALYAIWFKIKPAARDGRAVSGMRTEAVAA